ncbi:MAG: hypothetical protein M3R58_03515 [Pseudomonadota bacterium]|nr:hypothetical protein [Pseudomonadota bacterium]
MVLSLDMVVPSGCVIVPLRVTEVELVAGSAGGGVVTTVVEDAGGGVVVLGTITVVDFSTVVGAGVVV